MTDKELDYDLQFLGVFWTKRLVHRRSGVLSFVAERILRLQLFVFLRLGLSITNAYESIKANFFYAIGGFVASGGFLLEAEVRLEIRLTLTSTSVDVVPSLISP